MRTFLRLVLFVGVGPYMGLLAMVVVVGLHTLVMTGSMRDFTFGPELLSPGILIAAYSVGGAPALLTGIASIFIARWRAGWAGWLATALAGGLLSFIGMWVLFGPPPIMGGTADWQLALMVAVDGAAAGLVCAALFDGLAAVLRRPAVA